MFSFLSGFLIDDPCKTGLKFYANAFEKCVTQAVLQNFKDFFFHF